MKKEIKNFKRKEIFDYYDKRSNPFIIMTTKVDITKIYEYCNKYKNIYATISYFISLSVNEMDCFKYYSENGKIYKYDILNVGFTDMFKDGEIGFFTCRSDKKYLDFIKEYKETKKKFLDEHRSIKLNEEGEFWVSCTPWTDFLSIIPPFDKSITIPQFLWSKFYKENNRVYTNRMSMIHHGFADGSHIASFLNNLNGKIENFNEIIK